MVRDEMSFFVKRHELADGSSYVGGYERGKANGQGRRTWPNGDIYEGNFKDGVMEGYGVLTWHDGSRYEGDWANGKRQGRGDYKTPEGDHYNGIWQDDKRHGKGKQIEVRQRLLSLPVVALIQSLPADEGSGAAQSGGDLYSGEWVDDLREGKGTYKSADGDSYNGLWRADKMNGHGTYTWADGGQYTGQWVNDGREGLGVYRSSPSDLTGPYEEKYDGWWKADKMHGQGARRLPLSRSLFAPVPLTINIVLPAGKYYWSNGDVYDGMWREDKRHGGATLHSVECSSSVRICSRGLTHSVRQAACWCARRATGTRAAGSTMPATGAARSCAPTAGSLSGGGGTPSLSEMVMAAEWPSPLSVTLSWGGQYSTACGPRPCCPRPHPVPAP